MGRIFGIILIVAAVYFAANYVMAGYAGSGQDAPSVRTAPQRAGDAVRKAFQEDEARRDKLLPAE